MKTCQPDSVFKSTQSGVLYRNPKSHVRSVHAYFPSVVVFNERHLGATVVLGEAFESPDLHLVYFESRNGGETWERKAFVTKPDPELKSSSAGRLTLLADGSLLAIVARHERNPDDDGLTECSTIAFVPMGVEIYRSNDQGLTWSGPEKICPPIADTAFEICSPVEVLDDGTMLWPTSTWPRIGQDVRPEGFRTGVFVSRDGGTSWPEWIETYPNDECNYWEAKVLVLPDRRLLSVAWAHELATGTDRPNQFVLGQPDASNWSAPQSTGILGQTMSVVPLPNERILSVYRRIDEPGLWATVSRLNGEEWTNEESLPLWQGTEGASEDPHRIREHFATLKFGGPSVVLLPDGRGFVAFWCVVNGVSQISTLILDVSQQLSTEKSHSEKLLSNASLGGQGF
jgi:sialidase-1